MFKRTVIFSTIAGTILGLYLAGIFSLTAEKDNLGETAIIEETKEPKDSSYEEYYAYIVDKAQKNNPALSEENAKRISELIVTYAERYELNIEVVANVIKVESHFRPNVVSEAGAVGIMQIMPNTGKALASELGITDYSLYDMETNIHFGTYYLSKLLDKYENDQHQALTAYNRGPTGLKLYVQSTGSAQSSYSKAILNSY